MPTLEISTIVSHKTKQGMVNFNLNGEAAQFDLKKAREVVGMLQSAIEAAVSDQLIFEFLVKKCGFTEDNALTLLREFRDLRQGSYGTVYPT